ncbi:MAG: hypothetical protein EHM93_08845 [Bacteroidales bacterium]|nr:MAG: hypothetical protein EHM93_08845 [Bacteroidales bacterium]
MKKRVVLTLILANVFAYNSNAQLVNDLYKIYTPISQSASAKDTSSYLPFGTIKPGNPEYHVAFSAGYSSFGRGNGFSSSSVTPTVAFAPTQKVQIIAGATISYNNMSNMPMFKNSAENSQMKQSAGNPTQAFAYGQYKINNRFSVYAMGAFSQNQPYISPFYSGIGTYNSQEFGVGFNYKLGRKTTIGASFNFSNGPGAMGLSPFGYNPLNPYQMFP